MTLIARAEADLASILENRDRGSGVPVTLTSPDGTEAELSGISTDISQLIDPDTGQAVSGRAASAALRITSVLDVFGNLPVGIADTSGKPWLVTFADIAGVSHTFKVAQSNPDRALGVITLILELYET